MLAALINPALQARLQAESIRTGRTLAEIAERAIESYLAAAEAKREAIEQALERADAGHFVEAAAVHAWLEFWDSDAELPKPSGKRAGAAV